MHSSECVMPLCSAAWATVEEDAFDWFYVSERKLVSLHPLQLVAVIWSELDDRWELAKLRRKGGKNNPSNTRTATKMYTYIQGAI